MPLSGRVGFAALLDPAHLGHLIEEPKKRADTQSAKQMTILTQRSLFQFGLESIDFAHQVCLRFLASTNTLCVKGFFRVCVKPPDLLQVYSIKFSCLNLYTNYTTLDQHSPILCAGDVPLLCGKQMSPIIMHKICLVTKSKE